MPTGPSPSPDPAPWILVVDDRGSYREAVAAVLFDMAEVVGARDIAEALERLERPGCAVALLDVYLKGEDGFDLARVMRARDETRKVPLVFLTGQPTASMEATAYTLGAVDFMSKSVGPHVLRAKIGALLNLQTGHATEHARVLAESRRIGAELARTDAQLQQSGRLVGEMAATLTHYLSGIPAEEASRRLLESALAGTASSAGFSAMLGSSRGIQVMARSPAALPDPPWPLPQVFGDPTRPPGSWWALEPSLAEQLFGPGYRTAMVATMPRAGEVEGWLVVARQGESPYTDAELNNFQLAAGVTTAVHSNAIQSSMLQAFGDTLATYLTSGSASTAAHDLLRSGLRVTASQAGFVATVQGDDRPLLAWRDEAHLGAIESEEVCSVASRTEARLRPDTAHRFVDDAIRTGMPQTFSQPGLLHGLDQLLVVPMTGPCGVVGVVAVGRAGPTPYGEVARQRLGALARLGAVFVRAHLDQAYRSALEVQLRQAQKMEAMGRLSGGIAHDFNNLLQIILGYADLLLGQTPAEDEDHELLGRIRNAGQRATGLTRQLLVFSRRQVVETRPLHLGSLVTEAEKLYRRLIGQDITIRVSVAPGLWLVEADAGMMEQVLLNLLVNARDAMPEGGRIDVRVSNVDLTEASANAPAGRYVELEVKDTGTGIPADVLPYIFEPFFTTKDRDRGTGLGLSTVHGIVHQSGGHISVASTSAEGTSFRVLIPARADQDAAVVEQLAEAPPPGGGEAVLLVEDDPDVATICRTMLEASGYNVVVADRMDTALALCQSRDVPIDVAITDLVLPGGGGVALAARLHDLRPDVEVIFSTGFTIHEHSLVRSDGTPALVLHKPFDRPTLIRAVQSALAGRAQQRPVRVSARPRALVVDDVAMTVTLMAAMLSRLGWDCDEATSGTDALERLAVTRYPLVFLDCHMPDIDGYTVARMIREQKGIALATPPDVPIIGVTAMSGLGDVEACLAAGMDDTVAKPITYADLDRVLKHWRGRSHTGPPRAAQAPEDTGIEYQALLEDLGRSATHRVLQVFLDDLVDKRQAMRHAVARGDPTALFQAAHGLRGAAGNLGAQRLTELCRALERAGRAGELTSALDLVRQLDDEARRIEAFLSGVLPLAVQGPPPGS